jgi:hypothetical protein
MVKLRIKLKDNFGNIKTHLWEGGSDRDANRFIKTFKPGKIMPSESAKVVSINKVKSRMDSNRGNSMESWVKKECGL